MSVHADLGSTGHYSETRLLFGRPLRTDEQASEQLGAARGVPVLGLDALASAAYGPEAALTVLIAAGAAASHLVGSIAAAVVAVLGLVYLSYFQTLGAYPNGDGSYTVAKENLGARWGVIAATALRTDYVLNVAVAIAAGVGRPTPPTTVSTAPVSATVGVWLVLRAFASGCTALTGVEAVSNAVPLFRLPSVRRAKQTLTAIVIVLALLLVTAAVLGRGAAYTLVMASVLMVLCLSANMSFADFPRVCHLLAEDGYLPRTFASRGERLVYSAGIVVLTILAALLLIVFGGVTDALIPLFAVGAFSAFTLSQAGMVVHWRRERRSVRMACNAAGATATGASLAVIIAAKFIEGAWLTLIIIPAGYAFFAYTQRVHARTSAQLAPTEPLDLVNLHPPVAIVPVSIDRSAIKAVRFALSMGVVVHGVHVVSEDEPQDDIEHDWHAD